MSPRDQADAGGDDPTKTVQLDDSYRLRISCSGESVDRRRVERRRQTVPPSSRQTPPLDDNWQDAASALAAALAEFKIAASAVLDRLKAGDCLPKDELDRELRARLQLIKARKRVERLGG